jgi:hypothetical protein
MGIPISEVGLHFGLNREGGDHEVHKGHVMALANKQILTYIVDFLDKNIKTSHLSYVKQLRGNFKKRK